MFIKSNGMINKCLFSKTQERNKIEKFDSESSTADSSAAHPANSAAFFCRIEPGGLGEEKF